MGDADRKVVQISEESSKKKVPKKHIAVLPSNTTYTTTNKEKRFGNKNSKDSKTVTKIPTSMCKTLHQSKHKGSSSTDPKIKLDALQSHPQESLGAFLANEESEVKAPKKVSIRRKGSFDRDSVSSDFGKEDSCDRDFVISEHEKEDSVYRDFLSSELGKEHYFGRDFLSSELGKVGSLGRNSMSDELDKEDSVDRDFLSSELGKVGSPGRDSISGELGKERFSAAALSKVDSGQIMFEKCSEWNGKLKSSILGVSNHTKSRSRENGKELLTHVSDVQKVTSSIATSSEDSLTAEEFESILEFFANLPERFFKDNSVGWYDDSEDTWDEGEIVFQTDKLIGYPGRNTKMSEDIFLTTLEPSLDEILRKEEEEKTYRKRFYKSKQ